MGASQHHSRRSAGTCLPFQGAKLKQSPVDPGLDPKLALSPVSTSKSPELSTTRSSPPLPLATPFFSERLSPVTRSRNPGPPSSVSLPPAPLALPDSV